MAVQVAVMHIIYIKIPISNHDEVHEDARCIADVSVCGSRIIRGRTGYLDYRTQPFSRLSSISATHTAIDVH